MTPAPSSPVPAVEAERTNEQLLNELGAASAECERNMRSERSAFDGAMVRFNTARAAVLARMSTPTPGRAAEPDTMAKVARLAADLVAMARHNPPGSDDQPKAPEAASLDALLSAVRTIVTERDNALVEAERLSKEADGQFVDAAINIMKANPGFSWRDYQWDGITADDFEEFFKEDLNEAWRVAETAQARAETAEAQLATLRAKVEGLRDAVKSAEWRGENKAYADVFSAARRVYAHSGNDLSDCRAVMTFAERYQPRALLHDGADQ